MRYNAWVFTIWGKEGAQPTREEGPDSWDKARLKYCVWQLEVGADNKPHYQGYFTLKHGEDLNWLKRNFHSTAHYERRRGNHVQADHYARKPVDDCECEHCESAVDRRLAGPWTIGTPPEQGKRTDMVIWKERLDEGATEAELAEEFVGITMRYPHAYHTYKSIMSPTKREWITYTTVFWGPSGTGKSRRVFHEAGDNYYVLTRPSGPSVWWDGYEGQEVVVIDEFYGWISSGLFLLLLDRYPMTVQTRKGNVQFVAKKIFITSNKPPHLWWDKDKPSAAALQRRLEGEMGRVIEMSQGVWTPPGDPEAPEPPERRVRMDTSAIEEIEDVSDVVVLSDDIEYPDGVWSTELQGFIPYAT